MKKIQIGFIAALAAIFIISSCNRDISIEISDAQAIGDGFFQGGSNQDFGPYASWLGGGEPIDGYQGLKFMGHDVEEYSQALFYGGSFPNHDDGANYLSAGHSAGDLLSLPNEDRVGVFRSDFEGREVTYSFNGSSPYQVSIYCPESFRIDEAASFPSDIKKSAAWHEVSRNGIIRFNKDESNTNGVYVAIVYKGITTNPSYSEIVRAHSGDIKIERVAYYPEDVGAIKLSAELFEGIPKQSIVSLTMFRGTTADHIDGSSKYVIRNNVQRGIDLALID